MSIDEKDRFFDFLIPIIILKVDETHPDNKTYIKDVFLRLQKGEKVASYDILKNLSYPIINVLNHKNLFKTSGYESPESKYINLVKILNIRDINRTSNKKWKQFEFPLKIITSCLIIYNKSLVIGSYLNTNLNNELKNIKTGYLRITKLNELECKNALLEFEKFINDLENKKVYNIHIYLFYILLFLYITNKPKYDIYINNEINKTKIIKKCNDLTTYEVFKKKDSNNPKKILDGYDLEKLIGYIDVDITCTIKTQLTDPNQKNKLQKTNNTVLNNDIVNNYDDKDDDNDNDNDYDIDTQNNNNVNINAQNLINLDSGDSNDEY